MSKKKLVTTRDIVIPAGTEVVEAPWKTVYGEAHGEIIEAIGLGGIISMRFPLSEAKREGLLAEE